MNKLPRLLVLGSLVSLTAAICAQGIGSGTPLPRQGKSKAPALEECIDRARKSEEAASGPGTSPKKLGKPCPRVLAAQEDEKPTKSNPYVYDALRP